MKVAPEMSYGPVIESLLERLEASPNPAWAVDQDQRITFMNSACHDALGVAAGEALGQECFTVCRSLTARGKLQCRKDCASILSAKAGSVPAMGLMRLRRSEAGERWLMCSSVPFGDSGEPSFTLLHMAQDVTDMVEAYSLLSNWASRATKGRYRSPVAPARSPRGERHWLLERKGS